MSDSDALYAELKPDIQGLAGPLFEVSDGFVRERGAFLPHGAVLNANGEARLIVAAPPGFEDRGVSTTEVLPMLHEALRAAAREEQLRAVAVCEDVTIAPEAEKKTAAIKVLVEHQRGLCVALYLPYQRKWLGGYSFGSVFAKPAIPEVRIWGDAATT
jgi:hypothetical protein